MGERFWELDFARGCAVILMVIYHFFYDMNFFGGGHYDISSGILWIVGRSAAVMFVFLAGVSMAISYSRNPDFRKFVARGAKILSIAAGITLVTWLLFPGMYIAFGVLHLIGLSAIMAYPFIRYRRLNFALGVLIIAIGIVSFSHTISVPWLLWLFPYSFNTFDYFPMFPWFGLVLLGIAAGNHFYLKGLPLKPRLPVMQNLGRHSLLIYLAHQPVLVAIIYILTS